jgi:N utilization substance protein A
MKPELIEALEQIVKEKGISRDFLFQTLEDALVSAYKKNFNTTGNVRIEMDEKTGEVKIFAVKNVTEEVYDPQEEITVEDAKKIDPNFELGDIVEEEVTPKNFGRIAAQTAKQLLVQRIKEAERQIIYDAYKDRETDIVNGSVQRFSKGIVFVNLGRTEGVLLPHEQLKNESYDQGKRLKCYIIEVSESTKGPQILLSRTHPGLVKRLFELEVPEIHDGEVEIRSISREAGSRTKIAVYAPDQHIDAVGACVGQRGSRVQAVVDDLNGEKIDIIEWHEDPRVFISNALSPSEVIEVILEEETKGALVVVPDYQLSLAIGKEGQNARLAAKLTGWKVDIKSESQYADMYEQEALAREAAEAAAMTEDEEISEEA